MFTLLVDVNFMQIKDKITTLHLQIYSRHKLFSKQKGPK